MAVVMSHQVQAVILSAAVASEQGPAASSRAAVDSEQARAVFPSLRVRLSQILSEKAAQKCFNAMIHDDVLRHSHSQVFQDADWARTAQDHATTRLIKN